MYMFTGKMSDVIFSEWSDLWNGLLSAPWSDLLQDKARTWFDREPKHFPSIVSERSLKQNNKDILTIFEIKI